MTNTSIKAAFERMWQHIVSALAGKADLSHIQTVDKGGTGATTAPSARANLGFVYSETAPTETPVTGDGTICFVKKDDAPLSIEEGGTGGITATEALDNLDVGKYIAENFITPVEERYAFTTSTTMADTGFILNIPAKSYINITVCAVYSYSKPTAVMIELGTGAWSEGYVANNNASATLCTYVETATTLKVKAKYASAASNYFYMYGYIMNFEK